jgi:pre-mRNA-splicing factor ATP-dependent RNA helicase DHX38/PRP16
MVMASSAAAGTDEFTHKVAIKLSRVLNIINPNDLLARTVIDVAKSNSFDDFAKGTFKGVLFVAFS